MPGIADDLSFWPREEREHEVFCPLALEDPVCGDGEGKEDAGEDLKGGLGNRDGWMDQRGTAREVMEAAVEADEELVFKAAGMGGCLLQLCMRARTSERLLNLADCLRNDQPQQQRHDAEQREVVEEHSDRPRNPPRLECVHPWTHRGRDRHGDEEQRDHDPDLPERQRERDHADTDRSHNQSLTGGGHLGRNGFRSNPVAQPRRRRDEWCPRRPRTADVLGPSRPPTPLVSGQTVASQWAATSGGS
jgi:hypothetical protein